MLSTAESKWLMPHEKLDGVALIDHLFNRLDGLYPGRWRANFRDNNAIVNWRDSWAEGLDEDGVTLRDVAVGIKNCRRMYDWPPSLTEFLKACRPQIQPEIAFREAVQGLTARRSGEMGNWGHPAIYFAAVAIGEHDMLGTPYPHIKNAWRKALDEELSKGEWPPIPEPRLALSHSGAGNAPNEQISAGIAAMGTVAAVGVKDHKAWARKILDNPKNRASVAVKMAKAALGVQP